MGHTTNIIFVSVLEIISISKIVPIWHSPVAKVLDPFQEVLLCSSKLFKHEYIWWLEKYRVNLGNNLFRALSRGICWRCKNASLSQAHNSHSAWCESKFTAQQAVWITKGAHTHPPTLICDIVTCVQTLLLLQAHEYAGSNARGESEKCLIIVERIYTHAAPTASIRRTPTPKTIEPTSGPPRRINKNLRVHEHIISQFMSYNACVRDRRWLDNKI